MRMPYQLDLPLGGSLDSEVRHPRDQRWIGQEASFHLLGGSLDEHSLARNSGGRFNPAHSLQEGLHEVGCRIGAPSDLPVLSAPNKADIQLGGSCV